MGRTLFIGDSHTCGYDTVPGKIGPDSFSVWNENSYAEIYSEIHNKPAIVYAMPGANNRSYVDWMKAMFDKYDDIDEVFVLLSSLNRFILGFNEKLSPNVVPVDEFTHFEGTHKLVDRYLDQIITEGYFQLYQKPTDEDYSNFPGISFSYENGLTDPDIRKATYMQIKMFFELNTHLEQRDFFKDIYTMDNMCADHNVPLYMFKMRERTFFPQGWEFYGKLKATVLDDNSIETYFANKNIDHSKYFTSDQEHYNYAYHKLVAEKYLKHLTKT